MMKLLAFIYHIFVNLKAPKISSGADSVPNVSKLVTGARISQVGAKFKIPQLRISSRAKNVPVSDSAPYFVAGAEISIWSQSPGFTPWFSGAGARRLELALHFSGSAGLLESIEIEILDKFFEKVLLALKMKLSAFRSRLSIYSSFEFPARSQSLYFLFVLSIHSFLPAAG